MTGKKRDKPLYLDLEFEEALERFAQTDPKEVKRLIERGKQKKPPEEKASPERHKSKDQGEGGSDRRRKPKRTGRTTG